MRSVTISDKVKTKCPGMRLGLLLCKVRVKEENEELWEAITETVSNLQKIMTRDHISHLPVIRSSREAYRALGKDPARYRLSAEALLRRVLGGKSLYKVNNVVDLLNFVSVQTGFSIGGYDADQISGNITLDEGKEGEPYQAIGRGDLNIANLPVLKDENGPFGTPTSDSVRTSVNGSTKNFLMVFFDFGKSEMLDQAMKLAADLLSAFAAGTNFRISHV